jgi:hypothetical protein
MSLDVFGWMEIRVLRGRYSTNPLGIWLRWSLYLLQARKCLLVHQSARLEDDAVLAIWI